MQSLTSRTDGRIAYCTHSCLVCNILQSLQRGVDYDNIIYVLDKFIDLFSKNNEIEISNDYIDIECNKQKKK